MASSDPGSVDRKVLDDLYEDIHWLILVSGQQLNMKLSLIVTIHCKSPSIVRI